MELKENNAYYPYKHDNVMIILDGIESYLSVFKDELGHVMR